MVARPECAIPGPAQEEMGQTFEELLGQATQELYGKWLDFARKRNPRMEERIEFRVGLRKFYDDLDPRVLAHLDALTEEYSRDTGDYLTNAQIIRREAERNAGTRLLY